MTVPVSLLSPCAGMTLVWRFQDKLHLTTVVKATFSLPPTGTMALASPLPVYEKDRTYRNLPTSSVVGPSDRAPMKQRADITLSGRAYARFGTEVTSTQVRLSMLRGHRLLLNKTLGVRGDDGGEVAFATMEMTYERAYGGVGFELNPIGTGVGDGDAPNVFYPTKPETPAGYAPIPAIWPVRKKRLKVNRKVLAEHPLPLPDDFDWSYFQGAPADQQTGYLEGDETIELDGLHPDAMKASVSLPSARAVGAAYGAKAGERQLLGFVADALHLEPDERRCTVTWRSVLEVEDASRLDDMVVAVGVAVAGHPVEVPAHKPKAEPVTTPAPRAASFSAEGTIVVPSSGSNRTLEVLGEAPPSSSLGAPFALAKGTAPKPEASKPAPWSGAQKVEAPKPDQRQTLALPPEARDAIAPSRKPISSGPTSVVELDDDEILSAPPEVLAQGKAAPVMHAAPGRLDETTVSARPTREVEAPRAPHARGGRLDPAREQAADIQARKRPNPRLDLRKALYQDFV